MFIHYSLPICNSRNLCSQQNCWIHSIFYYPAMTQGCNTFFSYTAALYEQSKLQHPATIRNERQNTDHAMTGPQMEVNKGSSQSQFQEDVRVRFLSQAPKVLCWRCHSCSWHLWRIAGRLGQQEQHLWHQEKVFLAVTRNGIPFLSLSC